ncbi:Alcohol dehydrogenase GroES domain protein (plasmid) [Emticicia oligotrophica DSM 17448]|uniref:Alcohol dehydrogenase GroES domain protein n=1 Tax=Emticicia oligotrophica (strain DSM 17448 / CIP 109782 / MTCC 6937 / GPTSA100-15) TaxID=929562 RepID=A0ABM5N8C4_EMTOG|nr:alcohol dehydrogenase catalytic domain-containing protein [Emticicia oligotrophica]AFK05727.1 Alcohol dehydrogenase GroES domain protein [Emticicia oligotrophica DSM 17448]
MITCKAAIADGNGCFSIENIMVDEPIGDEVLVQIKAAGVCHTDWDSQSWKKPLVMGHEGAGVVVKVGERVKSLKVGDKVMLNWAIPCYECFQCQEGNQHICERNSAVIAGNKVSEGHAKFDSTTFQGKPIERAFSLGTMSEYTLVREAACVKINVEIPFTSAAIVGCGVMTGYGSVVNAAKVQAGSSVVVLGTGGVGLNVIQGARIVGAGKIIAIDVNPNRLEMAKEYGATHTILANRDDKGLMEASKIVKQMTGGRGADYAFECTAIPELGAAPLAMVRNAGMAVQVSGIEQEISIDMNLFEWDKIYINPLYGKTRPQIDFPILQNLYAKGDLILDQMVTRTYKLEELADAFADMHAGKNAKGVIAF